MSDQRLRDLYAAAADSGESHLDEQLWERLACGEVDESERTRALDHASACPECAEIYRTLLELESQIRDRGLEVPASNLKPPVRRSAPWWLGLAAAAAIVLWFALPLARPPQPSPQNDDQLRTQTHLQRPEPLAPIADLAGPPHGFSWRGLGDGWSYRVELLDAGAEPLWQSAAVAESPVEWPAELSVDAGLYYWRVVASPISNGTPIESRLVSFVLP